VQVQLPLKKDASVVLAVDYDNFYVGPIQRPEIIRHERPSGPRRSCRRTGCVRLRERRLDFGEID
jgi:hypothetical protein